MTNQLGLGKWLSAVKCLFGDMWQYGGRVWKGHHLKVQPFTSNDGPKFTACPILFDCRMEITAWAEEHFVLTAVSERSLFGKYWFYVVKASSISPDRVNTHSVFRLVPCTYHVVIILWLCLHVAKMSAHREGVILKHSFIDTELNINLFRLSRTTNVLLFPSSHFDFNRCYSSRYDDWSVPTGQWQWIDRVKFSQDYFYQTHMIFFNLDMKTSFSLISRRNFVAAFS